MKKVITVLAGILLSAGLSITAGAAGSEPVLIHTEAELAAIENDLGGNYKLANNISLNGEWTPIGSSQEDMPFFTGILDGDGYTIKGLELNSSEEFCGMFMDIEGGTVRNLGIELSAAGIKSAGTTGGLTGFLDSGGRIENCYVKGDITSDGGSAMGLLAGYVIDGTISRSYSEGNVSGDQQIGGLAGYVDGGSIINCYSFANVSGNNSVGGLVGEYDGGTVSNSYFGKGTVYSGGAAGRLIGRRYDGTADGSYYETSGAMPGIGDDRAFNMGEPDSIIKTVLTGGNSLPGWDSDIWWFPKGDYPRFKTDADVPGSVPLPAPENPAFSMDNNLSLNGWCFSASFQPVSGTGSYTLRLYDEHNKQYGGELIKYIGGSAARSNLIKVNINSLVKEAMADEHQENPDKSEFTYYLGVTANGVDGVSLNSPEVKAADGCRAILLTSVSQLPVIKCRLGADIQDQVSDKTAGAAGGREIEIGLNWYGWKISTAFAGKSVFSPSLVLPERVVNALNLSADLTLEVYSRSKPPLDLKWSHDDPGKAVWTLSGRARAVAVQLLKNGVPKGEWKTIPYGAPDQSYQFLKMIKKEGSGSYRFRIKALGSMDGYIEESEIVIVGAPYNYYAPLKPDPEKPGIIPVPETPGNIPEPEISGTVRPKAPEDKKNTLTDVNLIPTVSKNVQKAPGTGDNQGRDIVFCTLSVLLSLLLILIYKKRYADRTCFFNSDLL